MFLVCALLISAMANALIYGQLSLLTESLQAKDNEKQEIFDLANTAMISLGIDKELTEDVRKYLRESKSLE
jgi:hypothetical protein